jgi:hypothetical protein
MSASLEYLRDGHIRTDVALLQEAREIASILAKAVQTARKNSARLKTLPDS